MNTSAPVPDADAEITAELPVLDVAAYEATLGDSSSHADSWSVSAEAHAPPASDVTVVMPAVSAPKHDIDHSGTHEMPALPSKKAAKKSKHAPPTLVESAPISVRPAAAPATPAFSSSMPAPSVLLPPSPPLIEELRGALAAAERRIEELHEHARIADVERATAVARANGEAAQLREQLGLHLEALQTARGRLSAQGADEEGLEDELFTRGDRIAGLERELAARNATIENQAAQIESARTRADRLDVDATNLRATLAHRDSRIAILEADMLARQQREAQMKLKLADALAASDPQVPRLRSEITTRDSEVRRLAAELNELKSRLAEREQDLQVAEESIRNLEIEVRDKTAKLNEASVTVEEWRAVIAESQRSILQRDSRIQQLEGDLQKRAAAPDSAAETGQEVALEGPARVLIRTDGNTDFVHVLGRRTRIGRGPDNELVLDTKHVSRYHAVLLAGPVHTAVEDLNSTNGVFVNGRRIARQILKDGDRVTIGRTQYRYTVRPS